MHGPNAPTANPPEQHSSKTPTKASKSALSSALELQRSRACDDPLASRWLLTRGESATVKRACAVLRAAKAMNEPPLPVLVLSTGKGSQLCSASFLLWGHFLCTICGTRTEDAKSVIVKCVPRAQADPFYSLA